jgi:hypothetical protein
MPQFGVFPSFASGTTPKLADPDGVLAIVFGTAPVDQIADAAARPINEARVCESFADFEAQFGEAPDGAFDTFTLSVAAEVLFNRYRVPRVLFVNVYDPDVHAGGVGDVDAADVAGADDGAGRSPASRSRRPSTSRRGTSRPFSSLPGSARTPP